MKKDAKIFIGHILESIGFIEEYAEGKTEMEEDCRHAGYTYT